MRLRFKCMIKVICFSGLTLLFALLMGSQIHGFLLEGFYEKRRVVSATNVNTYVEPTRLISQTLDLSNDYDQRITKDGRLTALPSPSADVSLHSKHISLIAGQQRNKTVFLTMGIPTVKRQGTTYLYGTIDSIIQSSTPSEQENSILVIFLAEFDELWINQTAESIVRKYKQYLNNGFIQIIRASEKIYPDLHGLTRTFNDSDERVKWRSKQNVDYAHLLLYCRNLSTYYIQLEDDIIAADGFVTKINNAIRKRTKTLWVCLRFSKLGFIGKLFHAKDLDKIAHFLLLFYSEQPCDLLLSYVTKLMTQFKDIVITPALFQHKGIVSSLRGKKQNLTDKSFRNSEVQQQKKQFQNSNPEAYVVTSMEAFDGYTAERAYRKENSFFWGVSPKQGDFYRVIFRKPCNISRIYVSTGLKTIPRDTLKVGRLKISTDSLNTKSCDRSQVLCNFEAGHIDTQKTKNILPSNIRCMEIEITKNQTEWLIIHEISIFQQITNYH